MLASPKRLWLNPGSLLENVPQKTTTMIATRTFITLGATLSVALATPIHAAQLELKKIAGGFVSPIALLPYPGSEDLVVADQAGIAYVLDKTGKRKSKPLIDVRSKSAKLNEGFDERGLLGLVFHPKFPEVSKIFVYYSAPLQEGAPSDWDHTSHISSFSVNDQAADLASEKILLKIDQPQWNHNSGRLLFGQDGLLYISTGDGGKRDDAGVGHVEGGNSQDVTQLLGKILRINIDEGDPYSVPKDNPFVGKDGRDEIFAWGLRNPWGMVLNPDNPSQLIVADVGQDRYAEVNVIKKGGNYGWRVREGYQGFHIDKAKQPKTEGPKEDKFGNAFAEPVVVYKNRNIPDFKEDEDARGISVTGGLVYQGSGIPDLKGKYLFGDWSRQWAPGKGSLFVADRSGDKWPVKSLALKDNPNGQLDAYVVAFGKDAKGEAYVLTAGQPGFGAELGEVLKLVPAS